jgi:hypothetical protein
LATCEAIRAIDPKATLIAPATSRVPERFLREFFASGILSQLDAVSVHPYRDYRKLRALIEQYAPTPAKSVF